MVRSDSLVSYYSYTASLLAIWTFFVISTIIAELHKKKKEFEWLYDAQCKDDEDK